MKKVIFCGMLLGLLTGMCFAQRGIGHPMGAAGNARIGPAAARPFPNVTGIGSNVGHAGDMGVRTPAKTVPSPSSVDMGSSPKTVRPGAADGASPSGIAPDGTRAPGAAASTSPNGVAPDAAATRDTVPNPQ